MPGMNIFRWHGGARHQFCWKKKFVPQRTYCIYRQVERINNTGTMRRIVRRSKFFIPMTEIFPSSKISLHRGQTSFRHIFVGIFLSKRRLRETESACIIYIHSRKWIKRKFKEIWNFLHDFVKNIFVSTTVSVFNTHIRIRIHYII